MKDLFFLNKRIKDFLNRIIKSKHLEFYIAMYISMNIVSLSERASSDYEFKSLIF